MVWATGAGSARLRTASHGWHSWQGEVRNGRLPRSQQGWSHRAADPRSLWNTAGEHARPSASTTGRRGRGVGVLPALVAGWTTDRRRRRRGGPVPPGGVFVGWADLRRGFPGAVAAAAAVHDAQLRVLYDATVSDSGPGRPVATGQPGCAAAARPDPHRQLGDERRGRGDGSARLAVRSAGRRLHQPARLAVVSHLELAGRAGAAARGDLAAARRGRRTAVVPGPLDLGDPRADPGPPPLAARAGHAGGPPGEPPDLERWRAGHPAPGRPRGGGVQCRQRAVARPPRA